MNNDEKKFDNIIHHLKQQTSELKTDKNLSDVIMNRIQNPQPVKKHTWLIAVRRVSVAASVFLIALFIFENKNMESNQLAENHQTYPLKIQKTENIHIQLQHNDMQHKIKWYCSHISKNVEENNQLKRMINK